MNNKNIEFDYITEKFQQTAPEVPLKLKKENIIRTVQATKQPTTKTRRISYQALLAIAACFVLLVTGVFGGVATGRLRLPRPVDSAPLQFTLVAYAEENGERAPVAVENTALPDGNVRYNYFEISENKKLLEDFFRENLRIEGENIEKVDAECQTGELYYYDYDCEAYLKNRGELYDIIVPYSVIQGKDYYIDENNNYVADEYSAEQLIQIALDYAKTSGDARCFLREPEKETDEYSISGEFEDENGEMMWGVISKETLKKLDQFYTVYDMDSESGERPLLQHVTMVNYLDKPSLSLPAWTPAFYRTRSEKDPYPSQNFSELEGDTLTVTVTFKDGTVQSADYAFTFDDDGWLNISKI